ncbi:MAG: gliding motility-associated C-terminal domain-containing protein, partial [Flavobacteriales bacterium]
GTDGALTLCISSPATSLFAALGGGAQAGGTWSGPSPVVGGMFEPATMSAGVYTYTVNGTTPCPNDQSTVSVTVVSTPDPGGPGFLTICATDAPDDLFSYLEGTPDQGGQWTTPSGTVATGIFDPASMTAGVYTYTIAVPPPCVIVSSTVTVDVIAAPDAGQDGAATLCLSGAPIDLFSVLGGSPDAGGAWTTSAGAPFSSVFDPAANAPGVYNYTVNGTAPCPADVSSVTIAVTELPNAGSNAILNLCIVGVPADLFNALGAADVGGTWIGPSGASTGVFTPGTSIAGNYTYTVAGSPPCPSASATVTVNVLSNADAGGDGGTTVCGSDGPVSLFTLLQGSPDAGGSWFGPTGTATTGTFDPAISTPGQYTYILYVPAPCQNDTAQVVMGVVAPVSAGSDGSATLCSNDASVALFNLLNGTPDVGGTWTAPNGGPSEGSFTPGIDITGGYVYTVYATAPCTDQSAFVTLGVNPLPNAGTNGSTTLCPEAAPISLFSMLGGSPMSGGSWTGPNGQPSNGIFDPATSPQGAYTYTVTGLSPCPNAVASSTATVFLIAPPNAGPDAVSCTLEFTLNATGNWASGSWTGPAGITFSDPTSPTSTVTAIAGGAYTLTWSVTSNDGCATQDEVTITFTDALVPVIATTDAICNGACNGTASVAATGGNGAYSFAWSGGIAGNTPNATGICAGSYTVTVSDANNCSTAAVFTIGEPEALDIDAIASVNETCPGSCDGSITITDPQGAQYSINGGTGFQTGNSFAGLCPGEYAIVMLDANGCTASGIASIASPPPVIAYFTFSPDSLLASDPEAQFNNLSSPNATAFSWDFAGLGSSTAASPTFTFPGTLGGLYTVCLTATDANGCPDTYCAPVQVFDALLVHVANVFSPNDDGINEGFAPVFNMNWAVGDYEFLVFNRWGELLYETHVVDEKWDGVHGGGGVETEVFVWKLRCRDRLTRQWIERIGHVTVLK